METTKAGKSLEELLLEQNRINAAREEREAAEYVEKQAAATEEKLRKAARLRTKLERESRSDTKKQQDQRRCNHEKGQNAYKRKPIPEYNIYAHQLPNGMFFIACRNRCGMKWYQGDTKEFLMPNPVRGNKKPLPNHTGKSFEDMWDKLEKPSISRSEIVMQAPVAIA